MRLAVIQQRPPVGGDALARLDGFATRAAAAGADLLVTPEMALTGYDIGAQQVMRLAEPSDGPMMTAVAAIARRRGIAILAGFPERSGPDPGAANTDAGVYNAAQMIDATGAPVGLCRKTHLFGEVDRAQFVAADRLAESVDLGGWRLGLAICYDIEFPEVARSLALSGAEVIVVPTANMTPFGSVATRLVPARAEENAVYLAYANYCGREGRFDYCGLSCIVGPDGEDIARAGDDETLLLADLSRDHLRRIRQNARHLIDRRPDLYR